MPGARAQTSPAATDPAQWVDRHGDALYRYALLRTRSNEQAEEAVQECLLAALTARESFKGRASERTWLIGILKRKLIDGLRKKAREQTMLEADSLKPTDRIEEAIFNRAGKWKATPAAWGAPHESMDRREFWEAFQRCIKALPSSLASAFLLREVDQVESEEICEVLGLSPTNLWTRLHRARLGLRSCLEKRWFGKPASKTRGGDS